MAGLDDHLNGGNEALSECSVAEIEREIPAPPVSLLRVVGETKVSVLDTLERFSHIPNVQNALQQLERFDINIEPLRSRLNDEPERSIHDVYDHIHEYVRALLHALDLLEKQCSVLHGIHTDREMSDAALAFARKLLKNRSRVDAATFEALQDFDAWMKDVRDFAKINSSEE